MALKNTIGVIVHHAYQTQAHCPTMVSSFQLSSGTICLLRFCRFYTCSNVSGRNPQIVDFFIHMTDIIYDQLSDKTWLSGLSLTRV